jgi:hypothetical protein
MNDSGGLQKILVPLLAERPLVTFSDGESKTSRKVEVCRMNKTRYRRSRMLDGAHCALTDRTMKLFQVHRFVGVYVPVACSRRFEAPRNQRQQRHGAADSLLPIPLTDPDAWAPTLS